MYTHACVHQLQTGFNDMIVGLLIQEAAIMKQMIDHKVSWMHD